MFYVMMNETPVGPLTLAVEDGRVSKLEFRSMEEGDASDAEASPEDERVLNLAVSELEAYFRGDLRGFSAPVRLQGPAFHEKVWRHLTTIPFGQAQTYSEIARALGNPAAARAVGNACARNPVAVIVPCHRVIANRGLGGFGGGLAAKAWLLRHEGYPLS